MGMTHKDHKPFNEMVFRRLCQKASEEMHEIVKDPQVDREKMQVAFLEYLLATIRDFCGVENGFKFDDLSSYPRSVQLKQEIIGIVDFDSVHEHPTSRFFYKQPIIEEYLRKAIAAESE